MVDEIVQDDIEDCSTFGRGSSQFHGEAHMMIDDSDYPATAYWVQKFHGIDLFM